AEQRREPVAGAVEVMLSAVARACRHARRARAGRGERPEGEEAHAATQPERRQRTPGRRREGGPGRLAAGNELQDGRTGDPPAGVAGLAQVPAREREVSPARGEEV